jgi:hypothetical protein
MSQPAPAPVCLLQWQSAGGGGRGGWALTAAGVALLESEAIADRRVCIIAFTGQQRIGKSALASCIAALWQIEDGEHEAAASDSSVQADFPLSHGFRMASQSAPETRGIWALLCPRLRQGACVLLLDCEGAFDPAQRANTSTQIATLATLIASTLVHNTVAVIDQRDVEHIKSATGVRANHGDINFDCKESAHLCSLLCWFVLWQCGGELVREVDTKCVPFHGTPARLLAELIAVSPAALGGAGLCSAVNTRFRRRVLGKHPGPAAGWK